MGSRAFLTSANLNVDVDVSIGNYAGSLNPLSEDCSGWNGWIDKVRRAQAYLV